MDTLTHKYIVENSLKILFSDNKIPNNVYDMEKEKFIKLFVKYSWYPDKKESGNMFLWHFYNPVTKQNYIGYGENALSRFKYYSEKAFDAFKREKIINEQIIKDLAYACHYLADLNEPHHTSDLIGASIGSKLYMCILIYKNTKWGKMNEISKKSNERIYKKNEKTKSYMQHQVREDCKFIDFIDSTRILNLFSNHMEFEAEISRTIKDNKYIFKNEVDYNFKEKNFINTISKIGEEVAKKSNSYSETIKNIQGLPFSNNKIKNKLYIKADLACYRIIAKTLIKYGKNLEREKLYEFSALSLNYTLDKILNEDKKIDINAKDIVNKILDNSIVSTIEFLNCFFISCNK